eukprot:TRINITY_DN7718_c0_g1_i1.p1 TRINITY_DN7718_c0_g1~~TRINITY_DN7718_c0_g1_i1.p1  ORF type:complete len:175 (+),score=27.08 TRINITY_DN7718_c0_g1_i1:34-558(+)
MWSVAKQAMKYNPTRADVLCQYRDLLRAAYTRPDLSVDMRELLIFDLRRRIRRRRFVFKQHRQLVYHEGKLGLQALRDPNYLILPETNGRRCRYEERYRKQIEEVADSSGFAQRFLGWYAFFFAAVYFCAMVGHITDGEETQERVRGELRKKQEEHAVVWLNQRLLHEPASGKS